MKTVFYAAYVHKKGCIFQDWESCRKYVHGIPNARYRKFQSKNEAQSYLDTLQLGRLSTNTIAAPKPYRQQPFNNELASKLLAPCPHVHLYTDGSYRESRSSKAAWAWVLIHAENNSIIQQKWGLTNSIAKSRNIDGEMQAVLESLQWLKINAYNGTISLHFDYLGLEHLATGKWQAKTDASKSYAEAMNVLLKSLPKIRFIKIQSHFNNAWNEYVDALAKMALST